MNHSLTELYDEMYGVKVKPEDLLVNMKLDNYHHINFEKKDDVLIATVKCDLANGDLGEFQYRFIDSKLDTLLQITPIISENVLYDRTTEINKLRKSIEMQIKNQTNIA